MDIKLNLFSKQKKFCFKKFFVGFFSSRYALNPSRVLALFTLALLPFLALSLYFLHINHEISLMESEVSRIEKRSKSYSEGRKKGERALQSFLNSDKNFISNYLEHITPLSSEVEKLEEIQALNIGYKPLENRLNYLKSNNNKMSFQKIETKQQQLFEETTWKLKDDLLVNLSDIQKILEIVEEHPERPQLVVKRIKLKKENGETYLLDMELIQRGKNEI